MKIQNLHQLEKAIQNLSANICLIVGPEVYQCEMAVEILRASIIPNEAMAFDYSEIRCGEVELNEILEEANTFPVMSRRRLVLVREANRLTEAEIETLLPSLEKIPSRTMVVFFAQDLDKRKRFFRILQEKYLVAEFKQPTGLMLEKWATDFLRRQGFVLSPETLRSILALVGPDLRTLASELEKLMLYAGKSGSLPQNIPPELISGSGQLTIFALIDAIAAGNKNGALHALAQLCSSGEHPLIVISMLSRHCRQVLIAKDCIDKGLPTKDIAGFVQIPSFKLDQFLAQTRKTQIAKINSMLRRLAEIDRLIKSVSADGKMLLERLICDLA